MLHFDWCEQQWKRAHARHTKQANKWLMWTLLRRCMARRTPGGRTNNENNNSEKRSAATSKRFHECFMNINLKVWRKMLLVHSKSGECIKSTVRKVSICMHFDGGNESDQLQPPHMAWAAIQSVNSLETIHCVSISRGRDTFCAFRLRCALSGWECRLRWPAKLAAAVSHGFFNVLTELNPNVLS